MIDTPVKPTPLHPGLPRSLWFTVGLILLTLPATVLAFAPQDQLRQLVGEEVGIYLEATDLKTHLPALEQAEWFRRLQELPVYQKWVGSRDYQDLQRGKKDLEAFLGKSVEEFGRQMFGTAVAISITPQQEGDPVGVLLTVAESPGALQEAITTWNKAEKNETEKLTHQGLEYYRRVPVGKNPSEHKPLFYAMLDTTFVLSDQEASIKQILDRFGLAVKDENATGSLNASASFQQAFKALSPESVVRVYVNPRSWEQTFPPIEQVPPETRWMMRMWNQLQFISLGLRVQDGLILETVLQATDSKSEPTWMTVVGQKAEEPNFLDRVPGEAVVVISGAMNLEGTSGLLEKLGEGNEQLQTLRQVSRGLLLGLDLFDDVLPSLGQQWGTYLVPQNDLKPGVIPMSSLFALQLQSPDENARMTTLRQALDNGLNTGFNLLAAWYNGRAPKQPAIVRSNNRDGIIHRWIENLGPYQPSYALTSQHLLVASTPAMIEQFLSPRQEDRLIDQPVFQHWQSEYIPRNAHLFFANLTAIRQFLTRNEDFFVQQALRSGHDDEEQLREQIRRTREVMTLFDVALVTIEADGPQLRLVAGVLSGEQE